jgi:hypothetical protein
MSDSSDSGRVSAWRVSLWLLPLLFLLSVLLLRRLGDSSLGFPDADRLLMDGVFILDFLQALAFDRIYEFTVNYFGQYPALSIGYRPPFFPFVESIFNAVFGVNMWSSRLAVLAFAVVGVIAWFRLVLRVYNLPTAVAATLLLVTNPYLVQWGWYTMLTWPVLGMTLLTGALFYRYTVHPKPVYLYVTAISFVLAVWTKQTAIFISIWFLLYMLLTGRALEFFKRREAWYSIIMIVILLAPLAAITLWLGKMNVYQSVGSGDTSGSFSRLNWNFLTAQTDNLIQRHFPAPVLILALAGGVWAAWVRDRKSLFFALLIVSVLLFFTYIIGKNHRYTVFWIPPIALFAAVPMFYLRSHKWVQMGFAVIVAGMALLQVSVVTGREPNYAAGYDKAARFVLDHSESPTVFFDGYNNGYFTYFMRAGDPDKSMFVLRGDKLLSSSSIGPKRWLEVNVHSSEEMEEMLQQYGVQFIVVEKYDYSGGVKVHQDFRDFLQSDDFRLLKEFVIDTNRTPLLGQHLQIFEYLKRRPVTADYIELKLPVVGQTIRASLRGAKSSPLPGS